MKTFIAVLTILFCHNSMAQTIQQLTIYPSNPTVNDTIFLLADLQFNSTSCGLDYKSFSLNGNAIAANAQHCVGIAQAICNITDTFIIGKISSGKYHFGLQLTHGGAPAPCTPGFAVSDYDTLSFVVRAVTEIKKNKLQAFKIFPNPVDDKLTFSSVAKQFIQEIKIFSISGELVITENLVWDKLDVSNLPAGVYFISILHARGLEIQKFVVQH